MELPEKILIRAHFSPCSKTGFAVAAELKKAGVPTINRTASREKELIAKKENARSEKIYDRLPAVSVAVSDLEKTGYQPDNIHIFEPEDGSKIVVLSFASGGNSVVIPESAKKIFGSAYAAGTVYANRSEGKRLDAVELTGIQPDKKPRVILGFNRGGWTMTEI